MSTWVASSSAQPGSRRLKPAARKHPSNQLCRSTSHFVQFRRAFPLDHHETHQRGLDRKHRPTTLVGPAFRGSACGTRRNPHRPAPGGQSSSPPSRAAKAFMATASASVTSVDITGIHGTSKGRSVGRTSALPRHLRSPTNRVPPVPEITLSPKLRSMRSAASANRADRRRHSIRSNDSCNGPAAHWRASRRTAPSHPTRFTRHWAYHRVQPLCLSRRRCHGHAMA